MNTFVLAADPGQGIGWLLAVLAVLVLRFGWVIGLVALAVAYGLRESRHPAMGLVLVLLLSGGSLLIAVSLGMMVGFAK